MKASKENLILLAEDDASMRRYLEIILRREGYHVLTAQDGLQAMQIAMDNEIDAIVADVIMPNLSGYDLCRLSKSIPHLRDVLFIMLSGMEIKKSDSECESGFHILKDNQLKDNLLEQLSAGLFSKTETSRAMFTDFTLANEMA